MPSTTVEVAFNAGLATDPASRTWTDITDYVELDQGVTITGGRSDERSSADANGCTSRCWTTRSGSWSGTW